MYAHWKKRVIRFLSRGRLNFSKFITDHNQATFNNNHFDIAATFISADKFR